MVNMEIIEIVVVLISLVCCLSQFHMSYILRPGRFDDVTGYTKFSRKQCVGNDLTYQRTSSAAACSKLCDKYHTCKAFQYTLRRPSGHTNCYIKTKCTPKVYEFNAVVYEKITSEGCNFIEEDGYALYGHNDKVYLESDVDSCKKLCYSNIHWCLSFDFNKRTRACMLSSQSRETAPSYYGNSTNNIYYHLKCGENVEDYDWLPHEGNEDTASRKQLVYEDGHCFTKYGPFGGTGGGPFTDKSLLFSAGKITAVHFSYTWSNVLVCLAIRYGETKGDCHGGGHGDRSTTVQLETDEYITGMAGHTILVQGFHDVVSQVMIITNKRHIGPHGGGNGRPFLVDTKYKHLAYMSGTAGGYLDNIVLYFHC